MMFMNKLSVLLVYRLKSAFSFEVSSIIEFEIEPLERAKWKACFVGFRNISFGTTPLILLVETLKIRCMLILDPVIYEF